MIRVMAVRFAPYHPVKFILYSIALPVSVGRVPVWHPAGIYCIYLVRDIGVQGKPGQRRGEEWDQSE